MCLSRSATPGIRCAESLTEPAPGQDGLQRIHGINDEEVQLWLSL